MAQIDSSYNIHDVVRFRILDRNPPFSRFLRNNIVDEYANYFSRAPIEESKLDFIVEIVEHLSARNDTYVLDDVFCLDEGYLYVEDSYKLAKWQLEFMHGNCPNVLRVKPNILARFLISGFLIDFLIEFSMARKGYSFVHASGVARDSEASIFSGRGGSGKSTICLGFMQSDDKWQYLGDDFVIVKDGMCYPYVTPLNLFRYNMSPFLRSCLSVRGKAMMYLKYAAYSATRGYAKFFTRLNPTVFLGRRLGVLSRLHNVFILIPQDSNSTSKTQIARIDSGAAIKHMYHNQVMNSPFFPQCILEDSYMFPKSEFSTHYEIYKKNLSMNITHDTDCYMVHVPSNPDWRAVRHEIESVIDSA